MNLQEEYFDRHSIKMPVIKYVREGYLMFKNTLGKKPRICLISIHEHPQSNHPNDIILHEIIPNHNGYVTLQKGGTILSSGQNKVDFDTYYESITDRISKLKEIGYEPVFQLEEAKIGLIEMFVYVWGNYIVELYKDTILDDLFHLLNTSEPMSERMRYFEKIDKFFTQERNNLYESWKGFNKYVNQSTYCSWIQTWYPR